MIVFSFINSDNQQNSLIVGQDVNGNGRPDHFLYVTSYDCDLYHDP